ncbi:MAG: response regulator [Bacteroidetes bacterium]|nr:response regulator [Bacteroidota bacterium]MBL6944375.1 response regulator [Bacteroidales bacterium]
MNLINKPIKILYAEDNPLDIDLTRTFFKEETQGFELTIVETGNDVFKLLDEQEFNILILDYKLPDIDGVEIIKKLRLAKNNIPIILLTGFGDESLILQSLKSGANHYIQKKGDYLQELPVVIRELCNATDKSANLLTSSKQQPVSVLYVEDSDYDVDLLITHFKEHAKHIIITDVNSATAAIKLLKKENTIDLVLCDLQLLDSTALDLMKTVNKMGIEIPFVIVTGKGSEQFVIDSIKLGAFDYITKNDLYLSQLPYVIENALFRFQNINIHKRHLDDLTELSRKLDNRLIETTNRLNQEINEYESTEKLLKQQAAELRNINQIKDQFFSLLAHDLRGPFGSLQAVLDIIIQNIKTYDRIALENHLILARNTTQNVYNLLQNLLEWSKTQKGNVTVNYKNVNIYALCTKIINLYNPAAINKNISLELSCPETIEIDMDENIVFTALRNLISNAIKFTHPDGAVRISANIINKSVHIEVTDNGIGMAKTESENIFRIDKFTSNKGTNNEPGTGLGLILSKELLSLIKADLSFVSEPGKGSVFTITLPVETKS